eukprot:scaffold1954_cov364-Prasinococcus_capsulatus_cf.AAC.12
MSHQAHAVTTWHGLVSVLYRAAYGTSSSRQPKHRELIPGRGWGTEVISFNNPSLQKSIRTQMSSAACFLGLPPLACPPHPHPCNHTPSMSGQTCAGDSRQSGQDWVCV